MKATTKILDIFNDYTFHSHYNINRVIEMICIRDCMNFVLSEIDFKHEDNRIIVMGGIDVSLKVIDEDVKFIQHDISKVRVAFFTNVMSTNII